MGSIKAKLGLKGKTKPGEMITRMNEIKNKKTKWEGSPADKKIDKKMGWKEGSKADEKSDKAHSKGKKTIKKII